MANKPTPSKLMSVVGISISYLKSLPPILVITAYGKASSGGWTNVHITPRIYVTPPADGIQEFELWGIDPQLATQVVSVVTAEPYLWPSTDIPGWVKGIRVYGENDSVIHLFLSPTANALPIYFDVDSESFVEDSRSFTDIDDADSALEVVSHYDENSTADEFLLAEQCHEIHLISTSNWPETKTEMENKCVRILGKKVCTKFPQVYKRTSTLGIYLDVCHAETGEIGRAVLNCAKEAVVAGGVIAIVTGGNFSAGAAVTKEYLMKCLSSKGLGYVSGISVKITSKKKAGPWKKV